jgi:hypothetical protein
MTAYNLVSFAGIFVVPAGAKVLGDRTVLTEVFFYGRRGRNVLYRLVRALQPLSAAV